MSTYTIIPSVAAHKKVFGQFGAELRDNFIRGLSEVFTSDQVENIQEAYDAAFDTVLTQVGKKSTTPAKKASKKSPKKATVKNSAKRVELIDQAAELDIVVTDEKIGEIRKLIGNKKKALKQEEKKAAADAKKAASDAKKAEKAAEKKSALDAKNAEKAEKKAALEAKKAEKAAEKKAVLDAKKAAADAKKAEKIAAKKVKSVEPKPQLKRLKYEGEEFTGINGTYLRVSISRIDGKITKVNASNWTEEGFAAYDQAYPTGFAAIKATVAAKAKVSPKIAKKKVLAAENAELIQFDEAQIESMKIGEMRQMIKDAKKAQKAQKAMKKAEKAEKSSTKKTVSKLPAEKKDLIASLVGDAVEGMKHMSIDNENKDDELDEEVIDSDEELELLFPGEDEVDEFEHDCLDTTKTYYLDEDYNVWDDEENHIGTYNSENDALIKN